MSAQEASVQLLPPLPYVMPVFLHRARLRDGQRECDVTVPCELRSYPAFTDAFCGLTVISR